MRKAIFILSFLFIFPLRADNQENLDEFTNISPKIMWHVEQLRKRYLGENFTKGFVKNRLLFYGPPGNGKTTIANHMARMTGANIITISGPEVVTRYIGDGVKHIKEIFNIAAEELKAGVPVIIFIDEIDSFASKHSHEMRSEHKAALQELWLQLDKHKYNPDLLFICATNCYENLSKTFLDRFGSNVIEFKNPDTEQRKKILTYFFDENNLTIEPSLLLQLAHQSEGLSIRSLEDFVDEIFMVLEMKNSSIVTYDIAMNELAIIQKKFADNISEQQNNYTLRDIGTILSALHNSAVLISMGYQFAHNFLKII